MVTQNVAMQSICLAREKETHYSHLSVADSVVVTGFWKTYLVEVNVSLSQLIRTLSREDHHTVRLLPDVL